MHAVVVAGDGLDVEVAESVYLQLECQSWLQVAVDGVLFKLLEEREKMTRAMWCGGNSLREMGIVYKSFPT